VIAWTF